MERMFAVTGAVLGMLAVGLGAFGAHGLEKHFQEYPDLKATYKTAAEYHLAHALAVLAVAWCASRAATGWSHAAGFCFIIGVLLFSGSLYVLSVTGLRWLGAVTPLGGLSLIIGWACLAIAAWKGMSS